MTDTIKYIFTLLGATVLSVILWIFIFLGDFQEIVYHQFEPYLVNQWSLTTGNNGRYTEELLEPSWTKDSTGSPRTDITWSES